jgi:hypothetical protein
MINFVVVKTIAILVAGAGLAAFLASFVPQTKAESPVAGSLYAVLAKADRLPVQDGACASQAWPQYEQGCEFDLRRPAHAARAVRFIALR